MNIDKPLAIFTKRQCQLYSSKEKREIQPENSLLYNTEVSSVYAILDLISNKRYVGSTKKPLALRFTSPYSHPGLIWKDKIIELIYQLNTKDNSIVCSAEQHIIDYYSPNVYNKARALTNDLKEHSMEEVGRYIVNPCYRSTSLYYQ